MEPNIWRKLINLKIFTNYQPKVTYLLVWQWSGTMIGENRQFIKNEPVEFEK